MTKSYWSRTLKYFTKEVLTNDGGEKIIWPIGGKMVPIPPYKAGTKQSPYKHKETFPGFLETKSATQLEREAHYLGRARLLPKPATHKHGGDGTVRRSSQRKPFRGTRRFEYAS
jgi:hypothetical protein